MDKRIVKTDSEWRAALTPDQYAVTRHGVTEPPFSGRYVHPGADGTYRCVCCDAALFDSTSQFDSGSGWPSFTRAIETGTVVTQPDDSHGMTRTEIRCARCDAHLGHLFNDGPEPNGLRYCVNSTALALESRDSHGGGTTP
ncbi:MAG TPA: peptide-methionine (R)-S-oxide reductase MsrB [Gammaproteobacteria bacterium]|nr:peptide-methionine (R)-S-oxide reductase MsrB [Gammaproteobacteria bacterium]